MPASRYARMCATAFSIVFLASAGARAQSQAGIQNGNFETGSSTPAVWAVNGDKYTIALTDTAHGGSKALRIAGDANVSMQSPAIITQSIDATPYRGKWVRMQGYARGATFGPGAFFGLWLRVDRAQKQMGFFDNMQDRPISTTEWKRFEIIGKVAPDAERLVLGALMVGPGRGFVDDVALDTVDTRSWGKPRALSDRNVENLVAFTRLLGYVRYFHPSSAAQATDWNSFALAGVRAVEDAPNSAELVRVLSRMFAPIAPGVLITTGERTKAATMEMPAGATALVRWKHTGLGTGAMRQGPYSSKIDTVPLSTALEPAARVELASGVYAYVPTMLYADALGTQPRTSAAQETASSTPEDRYLRLADVALAWNVFQHFYPYFDVVHTDWAAVLRETLRNAATDKDAQEFHSTLRSMVAALHDGHGNVMWKGDTRYWSPPVMLAEVEGKLAVVAVDTSEHKVQVGDVVEKIGDRAAADTLAAIKRLISAATPQWQAYRAATSLLSGDRNTDVQLTISRGGPAQQVTLQRTVRTGSVVEKRPAPFTELEPGIFYVDLTRVTREPVDSLKRLEQARGIIFEMRGYPGRVDMFAVFSHLRTDTLQSAQWLVPEITHPDRTDTAYVRSGRWSIPAAAPYLTAKKAFLTDGRAISYAESVMGIVEAYKLGEIVGETTAGTNGNVNPFALPGGYTVVWTGMKVLKHDGSQHHGVGIKPTIPVSRTIAGLRAGRDEQLEKALQAVR